MSEQASSETQVVVVVGGSSGIGRATALQFASSRAKLVLAARSLPSLEDAATACRAAGAADVVTVEADVNEHEALQRMVEETVDRFGRIDVVVHSAAVMAYGNFEQLPREVFEKVVDTGIYGTANLARAVLPVFRRQRHGALIVVSSLLASIVAPSMGAYSVAKWGQLGLIRTLQIETRDLPDVRISAVAPGGVNTPIYHQAATFTGSTGRPPPPVYSPERVARAVVAQVAHPRRLRQVGLFNPVIMAGFRCLPPLFDLLVGPLLSLLGTAKDGAAPTDGNVFEARPDGDGTHGRWRSI